MATGSTPGAINKRRDEIAKDRFGRPYKELGLRFQASVDATINREEATNEPGDK